VVKIEEPNPQGPYQNCAGEEAGDGASAQRTRGLDCVLRHRQPRRLNRLGDRPHDILQILEQRNLQRHHRPNRHHHRHIHLAEDVKTSMKMNDEKKYFFYTYRAFRRVTRELEKLQGKDFVKAESFSDRDRISRIFAAECYELAKEFAKARKHKLSLQYMKLACKLLNMSLRPKKLSDLEEIRKVLAQVKKEQAIK